MCISLLKMTEKLILITSMHENTVFSNFSLFWNLLGGDHPPAPYDAAPALLQSLGWDNNFLK